MGAKAERAAAGPSTGSNVFVRSIGLDGPSPAVPEDILCVLPQFYEMVAELSRRKTG